ncbi:MAG: phosphatase PAP2 family protein [Clostridia bacterium]|nr:phosphatase PAP2 family protein [Clostridia bacterium]
MELEFLTWVNNNLHGSGFINQLFRFITYLGEDGIAWALLGVVLLCFKKTRKAGLILLAGFASVVVLNHFILKNIINRPRPFTKLSDLQDFITSIGMTLPTSSSFPSGHTTISITSAVILIMCFGKKGAWSLIPAILISISRIFLCVHYPTDVLGGVVEGVILGILVTIIGRKILDFLEKKFKQRKQKQGADMEGKIIGKDIEDDEIAKANPVPENPKKEKPHESIVKIPDPKELIMKESLEESDKLQGEQEKIEESIEAKKKENK